MYPLVVLHTITIFSDAVCLKTYLFYFCFVFGGLILEEDLFVVTHKTCLAKRPPRFQANKGNSGPVSIGSINVSVTLSALSVCLSIYLLICPWGTLLYCFAHVVSKLFTKREVRIVKEEIAEKGFEVMGFILT